MPRQFSRRTQFTINSIIALVAAGGGIIALLNYFHPVRTELKPLTVNSWVWPQQVLPGQLVEITVRPFARNEDVIPDIAVVIGNFSSYKDGNGSWEDESRGFTDSTGTFRLRFEVPGRPDWTETKFTVSVSKNGYQRAEEERSVFHTR
jgi:hypothetical protein